MSKTVYIRKKTKKIKKTEVISEKLKIISIGGYFFMENLYELKEFLLEKKYYMIGGIIFLILLSISICFSYNKLTKETKEEVIVFKEEKKEEIIKEEDCYANVDIKGEVLNPGLYKVICDSRVQDVINASGGLTKDGDTSLLNLGKKVTDEMVIIVYSKKEIENINPNEVPKEEISINNTTIKNDAYIQNEDLLTEENEVITDTPVNGLISLNRATKDELMTLSGIGESKAKSIISYRTENGNFKSIEEIKNVKGIGDSIFEKIKDSITL